MGVIVDFDKCQSHAVCMGVAPQIFEVRDDNYLYVLDEHPPEDLRGPILRTLDDCLAIAEELEAGPRVVVVGAGFIGSEVAATCRSRGLEVSIIEALPVPLMRAVGAAMGEVFASIHRDHGVTLRAGVGVTGFVGSGRVEAVLLDDGSAVAADVAAAGDVARWHNPLFGANMRVEHWTNASEQAAAAARNLLAWSAGRAAEPFAPVPYFWSDQYGMKIQYIGSGGPDDEVVVVDGSVDERRFVAIYRRDSRLVAAIGIGRPRVLRERHSSPSTRLSAPLPLRGKVSLGIVAARFSEYTNQDENSSVGPQARRGRCRHASRHRPKPRRHRPGRRADSLSRTRSRGQLFGSCRLDMRGRGTGT